MNKPQQTAAIAICALGLLVLAIGAAVLLSELKKERDRRKELEADVTQLRAEIETLRIGRETGAGLSVVDRAVLRAWIEDRAVRTAVTDADREK